MADFKAPFTTVAYGTGVPPEGTAEPNPVSPYVFNRHLSSWQVKQNHERSVQTSANLMWDRRLHRLFKLGMPILQGKVILPEVKEILINHEASMARRIKENLGVDIRGNTSLYQKPYPSHFEWAPSLANFRLSDFVKFNGEDSRST